MDEKAKPNRKLREFEFVAAEYNRLDSIAYPERGTTLDDMLCPEYWANISGAGEEGDAGKKLRPWHRIEVRPADRSWWAELLVLATGPFVAKVHVLRSANFGQAKGDATASRPVPDGYEIRHRGKNGFTVVRLSDNKVLKEGLEAQAAAAAWLEQHLKTFA